MSTSFEQELKLLAFYLQNPEELGRVLLDSEDYPVPLDGHWVTSVYELTTDDELEHIIGQILDIYLDDPRIDSVIIQELLAMSAVASMLDFLPVPNGVPNQMVRDFLILVNSRASLVRGRISRSPTLDSSEKTDLTYAASVLSAKVARIARTAVQLIDDSPSSKEESEDLAVKVEIEFNARWNDEIKELFSQDLEELIDDYLEAYNHDGEVVIRYTWTSNE